VYIDLSLIYILIRSIGVLPACHYYRCLQLHNIDHQSIGPDLHCELHSRVFVRKVVHFTR